MTASFLAWVNPVPEDSNWFMLSKLHELRQEVYCFHQPLVLSEPLPLGKPISYRQTESPHWFVFGTVSQGSLDGGRLPILSFVHPCVQIRTSVIFKNLRQTMLLMIWRPMCAELPLPYVEFLTPGVLEYDRIWRGSLSKGN